MAFYNGIDEEEDELNGQQTSAQSSQVGQSQGVTAPNQPQAQAAPGDKSGSFVGIKSYLDANKNQSSKLGDRAAGVIQSSADQARSSVSNLNNTFNSKVDQNVVGLDQGATDLARTQAEKLDANQKSQVQKQYNAQYQGPAALTDVNDQYLEASKAVSTAGQNVANQGTEEGRKNIIKGLGSGKQYRGTGNLDNLLLQAGGGREKLKMAADANKDVGGLIEGSNSAAAEKVKAAQAATEATKKATRDAIGGLGKAVDDPSTTDIDESKGSGGFGELQNYLRGKAGALNTSKGEIAGQIAGIKDDPTTPGVDESTQLSPELLKALGIDDGAALYNTDVSTYLGANPADAGEQDVVDDEALARYRALADLSGGPADAYTKTGSYDKYAGTRKDALQGTLKEKKASYDAAQVGALDAVDRLLKQFPNAEAMSRALSTDFGPAARAYKADPSPENLAKLMPALAAIKKRYDGTYDNITYSGEGAETQKAVMKLFDEYAPNMVALNPNRKAGVKA